MTIRLATETDIDGLNRLFFEADSLHHGGEPRVFGGQEHWGRSREFLGQILADPNQVILIAVEGENVTGLVHAVSQIRPELGVLNERRVLVVDALIVGEEFQRRGIGTRLAEAVYKWGTARGLSIVELTVWSFNESAIRFYERMGFSVASFRMRRTLVQP
ncbi:MAG: GNAT family N-acetyltransferase [Fimbriimonas sp.]|nr:GNAT family N-acetyltransferase [Fimbriimonas sp.]